MASKDEKKAVYKMKGIEQANLVLKIMKLNHREEVVGLIDEIFGAISDNFYINADEIYDTCYNLLCAIKSELVQDDAEMETIEILDDLTMESLENYKTMKDLRDYVISVIDKVMGNSADISKETEGNQLVSKAKEYINSKYNLDITLGEICDFVAVSKNYFCYLFKKETDQSVWDYLTNIRIEKAKELLKKTDMKTYEVSYKVGYENTSYFTRIFKKNMGVSPQEYRARDEFRQNQGEK